MTEIIKKFFKLEEKGTSIKTEILAGTTTFFTMCYLFIISPKLLAAAGLDFDVMITVTAVCTCICTVLMGLIANKPYAVAPLLGETAFISFTVVQAMGFSINTTLAAIFICGILLFLMTIFNFRTYIVNQIPETIKLTFCSGLGMYFIFIALKDMGIVKFTTNNIPLEIGNFFDIHVLLGLLCFTMIIVLTQKKVQGSVLISILTTTFIGILIKDISLPEKLISLPANMSSAMFNLDFSGLMNIKFLPILFVIFLLVNIDTAGALIGLSYKTDSELKKPMIADSIGVIFAPLFGTTTTGAYLDSMTGINVGGKTGLTAITTGILFLFGLLFTPILAIIPSYAYAPALLYVGILIICIIQKINFEDITEYAPAILAICTMIFSYNIGSGIISIFLIYPIVKTLCGQSKQVNNIMWGLFILAVIYFRLS